jgi:hypothetical protein
MRVHDIDGYRDYDLDHEREAAPNSNVFESPTMAAIALVCECMHARVQMRMVVVPEIDDMFTQLNS